MFLPYSDTPNPRRFQPWVTWILLGVNVAVYLLLLPLASQPVDPGDPLVQEWIAMVRREYGGRWSPALLAELSQYELMLFRHGFRATAPSVAALFGSMFLHAGALHLFGNMLFLWIYGDNVEHRFGRLRYLIAYLASGVSATVAFALVTPDSGVPMVGASGAISGVLGAYFLLFPHNRVRVLIVLVPFLVRSVEIPARFVLGVYLVIDNVLPILLRVDSGVAHGAHLGGFVAGLAMGWWSGRRVERANEPASWTPAGRARVHLELGHRYLAAGQVATAYQHFWRAATLDPGGEVGQAAQRALQQFR